MFCPLYFGCEGIAVGVEEIVELLLVSALLQEAFGDLPLAAQSGELLQHLDALALVGCSLLLTTLLGDGLLLLSMSRLCHVPVPCRRWGKCSAYYSGFFRAVGEGYRLSASSSGSRMSG